MSKFSYMAYKVVASTQKTQYKLFDFKTSLSVLKVQKAYFCTSNCCYHRPQNAGVINSSRNNFFKILKEISSSSASIPLSLSKPELNKSKGVVFNDTTSDDKCFLSSKSKVEDKIWRSVGLESLMMSNEIKQSDCLTLEQKTKTIIDLGISARISLECLFTSILVVCFPSSMSTSPVDSLSEALIVSLFKMLDSTLLTRLILYASAQWRTDVEKQVRKLYPMSGGSKALYSTSQFPVDNLWSIQQCSYCCFLLYQDLLLKPLEVFLTHPGSHKHQENYFSLSNPYKRPQDLSKVTSTVRQMVATLQLCLALSGNSQEQGFPQSRKVPFSVKSEAADASLRFFKLLLCYYESNVIGGYPIGRSELWSPSCAKDLEILQVLLLDGVQKYLKATEGWLIESRDVNETSALTLNKSSSCKSDENFPTSINLVFRALQLCNKLSPGYKDEEQFSQNSRCIFSSLVSVGSESLQLQLLLIIGSLGNSLSYSAGNSSSMIECYFAIKNMYSELLTSSSVGHHAQGRAACKNALTGLILLATRCFGKNIWSRIFEVLHDEQPHAVPNDTVLTHGLSSLKMGDGSSLVAEIDDLVLTYRDNTSWIELLSTSVRRKIKRSSENIDRYSPNTNLHRSLSGYQDFSQHTYRSLIAAFSAAGQNEISVFLSNSLPSLQREKDCTYSAFPSSTSLLDFVLAPDPFGRAFSGDIALQNSISSIMKLKENGKKKTPQPESPLNGTSKDYLQRLWIKAASCDYNGFLSQQPFQREEYIHCIAVTMLIVMSTRGAFPISRLNENTITSASGIEKHSSRSRKFSLTPDEANPSHNCFSSNEEAKGLYHLLALGAEGSKPPNHVMEKRAAPPNDFHHTELCALRGLYLRLMALSMDLSKRVSCISNGIDTPNALGNPKRILACLTQWMDDLYDSLPPTGKSDEPSTPLPIVPYALIHILYHLHHLLSFSSARSTLDTADWEVLLKRLLQIERSWSQWVICSSALPRIHKPPLHYARVPLHPFVEGLRFEQQNLKSTISISSPSFRILGVQFLSSHLASNEKWRQNNSLDCWSHSSFRWFQHASVETIEAFVRNLGFKLEMSSSDYFCQCNGIQSPQQYSPSCFVVSMNDFTELLLLREITHQQRYFRGYISKKNCEYFTKLKPSSFFFSAPLNEVWTRLLHLLPSDAGDAPAPTSPPLLSVITPIMWDRLFGWYNEPSAEKENPSVCKVPVSIFFQNPAQDDANTFSSIPSSACIPKNIGIIEIPVDQDNNEESLLADAVVLQPCSNNYFPESFLGSRGQLNVKDCLQRWLYQSHFQSECAVERMPTLGKSFISRKTALHESQTLFGDHVQQYLFHTTSD